MIFALIVFLLVVIFLAFFIGKNLSNVCNFWFFNSFENVPVAVLALIAFGVGIVFCILVFVIAKIRKATYVEVDAAEAKRLKAAKKADKEAKAEAAEKARAEKAKEKIQKKERRLRKNKNSTVGGSVPVVSKPSEVKTESDNK